MSGASDFIKRTRRRVSDLRSDARAARKQLNVETAELEEVVVRLDDVEEAKTVLQTVGQIVQEQVQQRVADVVTQCLRIVFDDPYEFAVRFERKRSRTEVLLVFLKDGNEFEAKAKNSMGDGVEGGVIDVAAFALRLSCLMLGRPRPRRLLVADEPFRFVDARNRVRVREMIEMLAKTMKVQIVLVTHDPELQIGKVIELDT